VLLLDNGFQYLISRMHRSVEIVLIDCDTPFGNGFILPRRNSLRESVEHLSAVPRIF